jgi:N-acetylglucosaminyldiphosphoundecaprenol N-acetyl-beta-D-mannosaminyltransferase
MPIEQAKTRFAGVDFTNLRWDNMIARIIDATAEPRFTTIVTPNVDHIVRMDQWGIMPPGPDYRAAIQDADFCLCDSRILVRLAAMRGIAIHLAPGSDLTAALFTHHLKLGDRIAIVGGGDQSIAALDKAYPGLIITQHIPPMAMLGNEKAMDAAARFIVAARCKFIFVAVGCPQGEILLHRARQLGARAGVALSIGASIDFLTGQQIRAPRWMQTLGLEWAHRLLSDPKRMWRRYLVDGPRIFAIVWRWGHR